MNRTDADRWVTEILDEVFTALVAANAISSCLIFKGARVLNARLGGGRHSLDLDSNLKDEFVAQHPDREEQRKYLETQMTRALERYFERQIPVRIELKKLTVRTYPPKSHPMGWDAFKVKLQLQDLTKSTSRGFPGVEIDVAAPEDLFPTSVATLGIGGFLATGYTLERIAGEKCAPFSVRCQDIGKKSASLVKRCAPKICTIWHAFFELNR